MALIGTIIQSLAKTGCQATNTTRPPSAVARRRLANAATGSSKNMTPNRLITTSKVPGANGWTWASACSNVTLAGPPSASVSALAASTMGRPMSTPSAAPEPAWRAALRVISPVPQPTSSTRSPGATRAAASTSEP